MAKDHIITIDQSTSGTKGLIVNNKGQIVKNIAMKHTQIYPQPGWVEHDPNEIYKNVKTILNQLVSESFISIEKLAVLTITNQRETIVVWDKETGQPIYNAIVWQCRRSTDICQQLIDMGYGVMVESKTGLTLDPYFSASKIKWILENIEGAKEKASQGRLLLGTIDSWLIWNLTNGEIHATDVTNASRTLLYNIYTNKWDDELLELFKIPRTMLPTVKQSDANFGEIRDSNISVSNLPISGIIGDSQGALLGQHCVENGMAKATFGTGTSMMVYTNKPQQGKNGLVTSVAWGLGGQIHYALEGIINTTGDIIKWLKDELELFDDFNECEAAAKSIPNNNGVYLIPAFVGLGAPYWSPTTRAAIFGMSRSTRKSHIIRSGLESIVYQVKDIVELVHLESNIGVKELRVDGGATSNQFLMQFLADILNVNVKVSEISELSAMGSVYLGGLSSGIWDSIEEIKGLDTVYHTYYPKMDRKMAEQYYREWKEFVYTLIQEDEKSLV